MRRTVSGLVVVAALVFNACGNDSIRVQSAANADATGPVAANPAFKNPLPSVTVRDVGAKADINLQSLLPADKPLVIWFWAPH
jgi:hypothetical protein